MVDPQLSAFQEAIGDRWTLDDESARTGRSVAYRGRAAATGEPVTVTVLRSDLASAVDATRFMKQMRAAAEVKHPGILPVIDVGDAAGRIYFVTPWLDGETLRERLARERPLPLAEALTIARQVAAALGHAHQNGLLHKDVRPETIFLSGGQAMLTDVGLSRAITRSIEEMSTGTGLTLGQPEYMSPEHASGGVEIDARADLYSLGCVLYEMLTGAPPFTGGAAHALLMRTLKETPLPIRAVRGDVPEAVGTTVDRLLAKAPAARFADAAHVMEALGNVQ